jgi:hypothetical protein
MALSIEVSMKIDFHNIVSASQNVNNVLSFLSSSDLSRYDGPVYSRLLATILLACYYHQDPKMALEFKEGLAHIFRQKGKNFIITNQSLFNQLINILSNIEPLFSYLYLFREESYLFGGKQTLLFKSNHKEDLIKAAQALRESLLNHFFDTELAEFLYNFENTSHLDYLKTDLRRLVFAYFYNENNAISALLDFAKEKPLAAIFLIIGSPFWLERLYKNGDIRAIADIFATQLHNKNKKLFFRLLTQQIDDLTIPFFHHNSPIFLTLLAILLKDAQENNNSDVKRLAIGFTEIIFSRWLDLCPELEKYPDRYDYETMHNAVCNHFDLSIIQAIALYLFQSKRFAKTSHSFNDLKEKLMSLRNPDQLVSLGHYVIKGKYTNLTLDHFGAPRDCIKPLLKSHNFASYEPEKYLMFLLRPLTSWLWLKQYFVDYEHEYDHYNGLYYKYYTRDSEPNSFRISTSPAALREDPAPNRMDDKSTLASSQRERSNSIEKARQLAVKQKEIIEQEKHFNRWLIRRSNPALQKEAVRYLKKFKKLLKIRLTSLFTAMAAAINSGKPPTHSEFTDMMADFAIGKTLSFVPYAGLGLQALFGAINPTHLVNHPLFKQKMEQFEKLLPPFQPMDRVIDHLASLFTVYHSANVLQANSSAAYFEGSNWLTSSKYYRTFTAIVSEQAKRRVTNLDEREGSIDLKFTTHWDELIDTILADLLASSLSMQGMTRLNFVDLLSAPLTYVSDERLQLKTQSEDTLNNNIYHLSRIACLAYESESKFRMLAEQWGYESDQASFSNYHFIFKDGIQVIALTDKDKICLSFRGAVTSLKSYADVNFTQIHFAKLDEKSIKVHAGFYNALFKIWSDVSDYLEQQVAKLTANQCRPKLYITGHSLGGALASIAAFLVKHNTNLSILETVLCTFGQPRCGNQEFANFLQRNLEYYYRVVNSLDIIPKAPLNKTQDYVHAGKFIWLNHAGLSFDQNAYDQALNEKNIYNKQQAQTNPMQYLQHLSDHSMTDYQLKLARLVQDPTLNNCFASYLKTEFEEALNFDRQQEEMGDSCEEFDGREKEREKGKEKVKDDRLTKTQRIKKLKVTIIDHENEIQELIRKNIELNAELSGYRDLVNTLAKNYNSRIEILEAQISLLMSPPEQHGRSDYASLIAQLGLLRLNQIRNSKENDNQEEVNHNSNGK